MKRNLIIIAGLLCLATTVHAAADTAQGLYLQAGKEERSGSPAKAREIYESIIDRFPETDFAVKANDRLLSLQSVKQKAESAPLQLLPQEPAKPLPADPLLRRAVEAVRLKARAEIVAREESERLKRVADAREGRKISRSRGGDKDKEWEKGAADKVVKEFGATLEEISAKVDSACKEAGVKGECSEEAINKLSAAP